MKDETKYLLTGLAVIILIGAGVWLVGRMRNRTLPTGNISQATPSGQQVGVTPNVTMRPHVEINTSKGKIVLELRPDLAPKTVANFLNKWNNNYCDGLTFHRVEDWVVQGCDPAGDGTGGNTTLPTETSIENFGLGAVGVARKQFPKEVSNDSQFFITKKESSFLNGEYTYFGRVISGMEVVNSLTIGDKILGTTILSK